MLLHSLDVCHGRHGVARTEGVDEVGVHELLVKGLTDARTALRLAFCLQPNKTSFIAIGLWGDATLPALEEATIHPIPGTRYITKPLNPSRENCSPSLGTNHSIFKSYGLGLGSMILS